MGSDFDKRDRLFNEIYEKYKGRVYNYILLILKNRSDAEEVMQEVFVRVYRNLDRYDPERAGWLTWICRIARNLSYNHIRDRRNEPKISVDEDVIAGEERIALLRLLPDTKEQGALKALESKEAQSLIRKAMELLPDHYREVITLCDIDDMAHKDAASILGWSVNRINVILLRARKRLADIVTRDFKRYK